MILIFNTIINSIARDNFTHVIAPLITFGRKYQVITLDDELPELSQFNRLLITGSELSASQGSEWDEIIISIIKYFVKNEKPILGICHGHQMIARALAGNGVCRRADIPEFGWKKIQIEDNSLFKGISNPVFLESHYDEVYNLPEEFNIIAANSDCAVQAFQYKNLPIWGIQFHPEMQFDNGSKMVQNHLAENLQDNKFYKDELENKAQIDQNFKIFNNFINSKSQES